MKNIIFVLFILLNWGNLNAQEAVIGNFNANAEEDYIVLSWTTDSGYTCSTLTLSHSIDSITFNQIYLHPGVCGSLQEAQTYYYIHSNPGADKLNYYKLATNNTTHQLSTSVYFKTGKNYLVYPNPVTQNATIYLNNLPVQFSISFHDSNGQTGYHFEGESDKIQVDVSGWKNGKYIYQLKIGNQHYIGSLLVHHD